METSIRPSRLATSLASALVCIATPSFAQTIIYDCSNNQYSTNVVLGADIDTGWDGTCIQLKQGYDLNLNGHTITCGDAGCGTVVAGLNAGDNHVYGGTINGPWEQGALNVRRVTDATIVVAGTAVKTTGAVTMARIENCTLVANDWAIDVTMSGNTDFIRANTIGLSVNGIRVVGRSTALSGTGPSVDGNDVTVTTTGIHQAGADKKLLMVGNAIHAFGGTPTWFVADNSGLVNDILSWNSNACGDPAYCPAPPNCSNGGYAACVDNLPACSGNLN